MKTEKKQTPKLNIFRKIRAYLRLREAIRRADDAHEQTGDRYYVMPNGKSEKLIIVNRTNFRKLKQKGYINRMVYVKDLERESFYHTPYKNGTGMLDFWQKEQKRDEYYHWIASLKKK